MTRPRVSVLVNTRNEEANIRACLESVRRADEIVVVDMESEDRTTEIAREFTDKVYSHPNLGYADPARAFALSKASGDWVLILDADEVATQALWERLERTMQADDCDVLIIPFRTWMFGAELRGGGWGPGQDTHERFFRRSVDILSPRVHAMFAVPEGARVAKIDDPEACIVHFNYLDLEHFLEKYNRYTGIEACNACSGLKSGLPRFRHALLEGAKEFIRRYVVWSGWKDGGTGFTLAFLMAAYHLAAWQKESTMRRYGVERPRDAIAAAYDEEKARIVAGEGISGQERRP